MELNIPDNFLDGEVRDGFYIEKMMKRNWACMIKILAEIDRICRKHDIQYFADWGTLLGTVRHKGFVPWDDDIDIAMKRLDYMKFCEVAKTELPDGWQLLCAYNTMEWDQVIGHVVPGTNVNYTPEYLDTWYGFPYVPGIDIFPLDYMTRSKQDDELTCEMYKIAGTASVAFRENDLISDEEKLQLVANIEKMCGVKIDRNKNIPNQLLILHEQLSMLYSEQEADNLVLMEDYANYRTERFIYQKEWYESTIDMPFEYITVPVPVGYREILRRKYGDNWMRPYFGSSHEYPYYKKQQTQVWKELGIL